jgi:hypothetical protein
MMRARAAVRCSVLPRRKKPSSVARSVSDSVTGRGILPGRAMGVPYRDRDTYVYERTRAYDVKYIYELLIRPTRSPYRIGRFLRGLGIDTPTRA